VDLGTTIDLDLRLVRYVVILAEELNFARAAARLQIAQQTLSAQISSLERRLGVRLFLRDRRHVEITAAGSLFVLRGRVLLAGARALLEELNNSAPPLRVDVITEGLTAGIIAQELSCRMPDTELHVVQGQGLTGVLPQISEGRLDLAFGRVPGGGTALPASLSFLTVRFESIGIVVPDDHELAGYENVPMTVLAAHPLVMHTAEEASEWESWIDEVVDAFGLSVGWRLHGHGRGSANAAVLRYRAPSFAPIEAPTPSGIVVRRIIDPVPVGRVSVVWRSQGRTPAKLRRVIDLIHEISTERDWLTLPSERYWLDEDDRH